ncbi:hypothetical protein ABDD95_15570 [Mucilaginibacter sp. PAMB04274]|uniref:hypothetical protein n=1 Tax=Mucilaginibacter sp. PAMB04274 TaxID=3138568 RepID=UPI0031F644B2
MAIIPVIVTKITKITRLPDIPPTSDLPNNGNLPATAYLDGIRGYESYGNVYIELQDEYFQPVDGNNVIVTFQEYFDGNAAQERTVSIPGSSYIIQADILLQRSVDNITPYEARIIGGVQENDGGYTPPGVCDAGIKAILINKLAGPGNIGGGQITVQASSSYGSIQYKLNDSEYQSGATFANLTGGGYTAYIKDAQGCVDSRSFTLESVANLLIADPSADAGNGNISRWNAAFNPIVFSYKRRDFDISSIQPYAFYAKTKFYINGALSITGSAGTTSLAAKDYVYIESENYTGVYQVSEVDLAGNALILDVPYVNTSGTGFVNINKLRPYYQVKTKITYEDKLTRKTETITATHRPNTSGITNADISSFLQSLLRAKDESNYSQPNYRDDNLSASYNISYAEVWQNVSTGDETEPNYVALPDPYYVTYSARQLGDAYGGNMAAYIPFKTVDGISRRARWLTDFNEPACSPGYPFDIGFIYSEHLAGLDLFCEITPLDINRHPLPDGVLTNYLLNEDRSFLLNQDGSKLVIKRQIITNEPITQNLAQHVGLNRLLVNNYFSNQVHYFTIALKYIDAGGLAHTVTQTQTIRIDQAIDEQSVYMRWIGLTGSWNYYRFVYNQELSLDVQNAVIIKNHILDWANQDAMEDVISKSAGMKMKVMAEDLSVADIKGLQSIKYSPKVQMLLSKNPAKWQTVVLNTATFAEYETRNGQAPFSITFNLPGLNIQTQ